MNIPDNVGMLQLFQKRDFANGSARHSVLLVFQTDLLQSVCLTSVHIGGLVHHTVCALPNLFVSTVSLEETGDCSVRISVLTDDETIVFVVCCVCVVIIHFIIYMYMYSTDVLLMCY